MPAFAVRPGMRHMRTIVPASFSSRPRRASASASRVRSSAGSPGGTVSWIRTKNSIYDSRGSSMRPAYSCAPLMPPADQTTDAALPLAGVRILELANVVAGPRIGAHLSDFGAEVQKVERPGEADASRTMGEAVGDRTAWWLCIGRNKQTIALDLKQEADREAFLRLAAEADAVVESFRPGVMERLGLAPEQLHEVNSRLVVVRISAFGQTGPYADRPGFGTLAEAFSGLAEVSGYADRPPLLAPPAR